MLRQSLLLALFALMALSSAFSLGDTLHIDGIEAYLHHGEKRQATGTGAAASSPGPAPSSAAPQSSRPQPSTQRPSPTPAPQSTPDQDTSPAPGSPTPAPPTTSRGGNQPSSAAPRSSANPPQTTPGAVASSTPPRSTAIVRTSALVSTSLQEFTTVITTVSNGNQVEVTSTGTSSVPITTGQVTTTDPPTSQSNSDNSGSLSESNKKVIGGVVGGVGGALLLGGIALVFWRMKKRQHKVSAEDEDFNLNTGAALGDKQHNGTGASPFQSNLEQYHNPGGRPNAAANF